MGRKRMGETRRRQILEGLLQAVAEHGLADLNMSKVASAAGLSRGILHYYFKNKDEMIGALVAHLRESHFQQFKNRLDVEEDPKERLRQALFYPVKTFGAGAAPLAKVWIEFWGMSARHPAVRSFVLGLQHDLREYFRAVIDYGQQQEVFRKDLDAVQLASTILGTLEGLMLQWFMDPESITFVGEIKALQTMLERTLAP